MQSNATLLRLRLATLVAFSLVFAAMISGACVGAGLSTAGASGPSGGPDATIGGRVTAGPTCPV